jgi:hypothetical protein
MKADIRQILRDLRVAVTLGSLEAVDIAMDSLLDLPGVSSNDPMNEAIIEQVVIPVGGILAGLKSSHLRPLLSHPLAVGRAAGGVALANQYVKGQNATPKDLRKSGNDPRRDVRLAFGRSLSILSEAHPEAIFKLGNAWMTQALPRLRYTAMLFLPPLAPRYEAEIFSLLNYPYTDPNREVRSALVATLNQLARMAYASQVLALLSGWSADPQPDSWIICRTLSASWAASHEAAVKLILQEIKSKTGESSHLSGALKALQRHGVVINL